MKTVLPPLISLAALACLTVAAVVPSEELPSQYRSIPAHRPDRILIQPKPGIDPATLMTFHATHAARRLQAFRSFGGLQVLGVPEGRTVEDLVTDYELSGLVEYAEPDYIGHVFATPDDPKYLDGTLWGLNNTGQNGGVPGADIDAAAGWALRTCASNILTVAYTTRRDELGTNSNYGATRVHLAAPGERIHSTFAATDTFYFHNAGTSFAAPYVTGSLALMRAEFPTESHQQLIARLLDGVDPLPALQGKTVTGGRLNLRKALSPPPLSMVVVLDGPNLEITWTRPGPDHLYTLEARESLTDGNWAPIPDVAWRINTNRWILPMADANARFFRVMAESGTGAGSGSVKQPTATPRLD